MVSRATRVRLDPSHPDSKKGIGMSNVLKKAKDFGSKEKSHAPTTYADPDIFGDPKRRRRKSERNGESDTEADERRRERRARRERAQRNEHEELRSQAQSAPTHVEAGSYADKHRSRAEARREREVLREKEAKQERRRARAQAQAEAEMQEKENCGMNRSRQQRGFRDREEKPRAVSRPRGMRRKEEVEQPVMKNKKKKERKERKEEEGEHMLSRERPTVDTNRHGGVNEASEVDERMNFAVHIVSSAIAEDKGEVEAARRVAESLEEDEIESAAKKMTPLPTPKEENILKGGSDFFDGHFIVEEVDSRRHDEPLNDPPSLNEEDQAE